MLVSYVETDICQQPFHQFTVHLIHKARVQIPKIDSCHPLAAMPEGLADDSDSAAGVPRRSGPTMTRDV